MPGFVALDDLLSQPDARGTFLVQLTSAAQLGALCAHAARRFGPSAASARGAPCAVVASVPVRSLWREVGRRLGLGSLSSDVEAAAQQVAAGLAEHGGLVVGALTPGSTWDLAVAESLGRRLGGERAGLVLVAVQPGEMRPANWDSTVFELEATPSDESLTRWWRAVSDEGLRRSRHHSTVSFEGLEQRWRRALGRTPSEAVEVEVARLVERLDGHDKMLLRRLALVNGPWPRARLDALAGPDTESAARRLLTHGLLDETNRGRSVRLADDVVGLAGEATTSDLVAAAEALIEVGASDPWAQAQAAVLLAGAGSLVEAEAAHVRAIRLADDVVARADLWASWGEAVEGQPREARHGCYLRGAELALSRGDADGALAWAERAMALEPDEFASVDVLGKAALGRGDLVAADVALGRALTLAHSPEQQATALAGRAEVRYAQGRLDEAGELASQVLALVADTTPAAVSARNTQGKLLLASGKWESAEEHFALDATLSARHGDASAQLRARLNRAIATMSSGRTHEARPMLEAVLHDGRAQGNERAVAFALSNLAVLAINRHDYGEALQLSERAIDVRRRIGERLGLARVITNLAELRLRLGMVEEAEQALSFGQLAVSRRSTAPRTTHFALIMARIHLARRATLAAARELETALAGVSGSSDGDMRSECHRVGVRIALEDGDVERARQELERAEQHSVSPCAHAEVALLRAMILRSAGQPAIDEAQQAVQLARRAGEEELLREAHGLVAQIARDESRPELAHSHLNQALVLRDHVLNGLPEHLRRNYLARRDVAWLGQLERELQAPEEAAPVSTTRVESRVAKGPRPRLLAGEDPAIRGLLEGIRKVGRTDATVLVLGESGTGKELVAEALHEASARRDAPIVKVNCGALVESLLLSELFGHEKGAFTGAVARKRGRFEMAEGGTLFLDEIGDISPATQVALLRVLQERTFERVGGTTPLRANVRIVAATHRDLRGMVERGEFRQDLYFRLSGLVLNVPALRSRLGDLPILARNLLDRIADERNEAPKRLSSEALVLLARHRWPGNVRELDNALRAASLFVDGTSIEASDLTEHVESLRTLRLPEAPASMRPPVGSGAASEPVDEPAGAEDESGEGVGDGETSDATETIYAELRAGKFGLFDLKRQLERDCIARALAETRGNITKAASILGMKRPRLSQLVKQYGLAAISAEGT